MGQDKRCMCEERHQCHMCVLRDKGLIRQIERASSNPNVACVECGEEANAEDSVCVPVTLFV